MMIFAKTLVALLVSPLLLQVAAPPVIEFDVNGLKVLVKRRTGSPTVAAGLFIRGGARNITAENAGIESFMLDVATEASVNFPRERMRRELANSATSIGGGANYDYSGISLASTRRNFDKAWAIFTDVALRPSFAPEDFSRIKQRTLISRSDDGDTPDALLQILEAKVAFAGHPYANEPRGTIESITKITVEDIKKYHQQVMQTSRLLLVVVGDVDAEDLQKKVEGSFGSLPRGNYQAAPMPTLSFSAPTISVTSRNIPTNYVQGLYAAPSLTSPDIYALRVATSILEDRIFEEVRLKRSLSYSPGAFLNSQGANTGGVTFTAVDANQTIQVIQNEIAKLQTRDTTPEDIKAIAQQFLTHHYLGEESNAAQAGALAQSELIGGGWRSSSDFIQRLRDVTPAEVRRAATTYIRNLQFVVIGNPRSIDQKIFLQQR